MVSHGEFNLLLCEFFNDIRVTFDELNDMINIISISLNEIISDDVESEIPLRLFKSVLKNQEYKLSCRDITLLESICMLDLKYHYKKCDEHTKDSIWESLNIIYNKSLN